MQELHFQMSCLLLVLLLVNEGVFASSMTCGGSLNNTGSGQITSPLYPNQYPKNTVCEWTITSTFGQGIRIDIEDLDIKEIVVSAGTVRCFDKLYIYQRLPSGELQRVANLCASSIEELPSTVLNVDAQPSGDTTVLIYFKSDYQIELRGFSLRYTILCDTTVTEAEGTLTSPNYPLFYPDNTQCTTIIKTLPGTKISLTINDFQFAESDDCSQDYISIKSSVDGTFLGPKERYCNDIPSSFTSPSNQLVVVFRSDSSKRAHGISGTWSAGIPDAIPSEHTATSAVNSDGPIFHSATTNVLNTESSSASLKLPVGYFGTCSKTGSGIPCQRWDKTSPHRPLHFPANRSHNYCRNLDGDSIPWCYTIHPRRRWEHCNIADCVPGEATTVEDTTLYLSSTESNKLNISSFTGSQPRAMADPSLQAGVGVNGIYIVVGVLIFVMLCATIIIIFVIRKKYRKRVTRVAQNDDVIFQNLTTDDERENDNTMMRTRENTYVEIPVVPYDEVRFTRNGCNGIVQTDRNTSTGSDDSVSTCKREATLQRNQESSQHLRNKVSTKEDQPYLMADDDVPVFENTTPAAAKQFNPYQLIEDDDDVEYDSEQTKAAPEEEHWYASPRSPLSSTSNGTSLYDNPRPQQPSVSRGQRNESVESNYCPMNNSFIKKSSSPSKLNRNESLVSNSVPESIVESTEYVAMGPQALES